MLPLPLNIDWALRAPPESVVPSFRQRVFQCAGRVDLHRTWIRELRYRRAFEAALAVADESLRLSGDKSIYLERGYALIESGRVDEGRRDLEQIDTMESRLVRAGGKLPAWFEQSMATFNATDIDPVKVRQSLGAYGCAWIRGLFDPVDLMKLDERIERNMDGADALLRASGAPDGYNVGFPMYVAGRNSRWRVRRRLSRSYPQIFDPAMMRFMDCNSLPRLVFNALRRSGLDAVMRDYLKLKRLQTSAAICHVRRFEPIPDPTPGMLRSFEFHQDNRLYRLDPEILTLWFPFRYEHGAMPSLEFVPIRAVSDLPCQTACGIDRSMFDDSAFWLPEYKLGDAVLISGYSPHRTCYPRGNRRSRTSVDFRFFQTPVPKPIREPLRWV